MKMTKAEFVKANNVGQMPKLVQVLVGKLWDAAFACGKAEGYRQGVDAVALKDHEIHMKFYEEGTNDAIRRGAAAYTVAACRVLHRPPYRFGKDRMKRVSDGITEELLGMLDPAAAVREVRSWGVNIEWVDELMGDDEFD
jgi:hypothetical protein